MRMRSVRFSRDLSLNLEGSPRHLANIPVSKARIAVVFMLIVLVDPYHTYLSIAAAAVVSPDPKWEIQPLDPLINATHDTARWAKTHIRGSVGIS